MKYELVGSWLIADGQTILFPGSRRDLKALAELVRRANAYDGLLEACKAVAISKACVPYSEGKQPYACCYTLSGRSGWCFVCLAEAAIASAEGGAR